MLPSQNEISSTEKLLKMIRSNDATSSDFSDASIASLPAEGRVSVLNKIFPLKNPVTIGVDISSVELRLIKITRSTGQKWQLLDCKCVPLPPHVSQGSQQFIDFLRSTMTDFCDRSKGINVWTAMSSANVEVRHVQIPKVEKKEIANAVYWTVKKEFPFNEKENLFDFDVQGEVVDKGVDKIAVVAYIAPNKEVEKTKILFSKTGFALSGITIAPFAIQNLFRTGWLPTVDRITASLYIGYDRSHIDIFSKGSLVTTRSIMAGINSMAEALAEGIADYKKKISGKTDKKSGPSVADVSETESYDMELSLKLLFGLGAGVSSIAEKETGIHLKEEEIFSMILPAVNRLIRQVKNTFTHYDSTFADASVKNICISGGIPFYIPLIDYIGEQLEFKADVIDALDSNKVPFLGVAIPPTSVTERSAFGVAVGLALSDNNYTPNLIFTQKDEEKKTSIARINRSIFSIFLMVMVICLGIFWWMSNYADQKKAVIAQLKQQAQQYTSLVSQNIILQMADTVKSNRQDLKINSQKLLPVVIVNELSNLTPGNVRLLGITVGLGSQVKNSSKKDGKKSSKNKGRYLLIDGIISGDPGIHKILLARYMMRLKSSPIFNIPVIQKSVPASYYSKDDVLHFTLKIKLV